METSEASKPEVPETEVFETPEVFNGKGVSRLVQGTRRGLVLIFPQTQSQSWNQPGEKNILEFEKLPGRDLCRAEEEEVRKHLLQQKHGLPGANLEELVLELSMAELICDEAEQQEYFL